MTKLKIMVLYLMDNIGSKVMPIVVNLGISLHFSYEFPCTSNWDWLALPHVGTGILRFYQLKKLITFYCNFFY
jgi:hypothetical protein